jgi:hypothetical protein
MLSKDSKIIGEESSLWAVPVALLLSTLVKLRSQCDSHRFYAHRLTCRMSHARGSCYCRDLLKGESLRWSVLSGSMVPEPNSRYTADVYLPRPPESMTQCLACLDLSGRGGAYDRSVCALHTLRDGICSILL